MAATINPDILTTDHYNGSRTPNFTLLSQMAVDADSDKLRGSGEWTKEDVEQLKEIYYASKELKDLFTNNTKWNDDLKRTGLIAARYLCSLSKGEYALELATVLSESAETMESFVVPPYIENAIKWLLEIK